MSAAVGVGFSSTATAEGIASVVRLALARAQAATASLHASARKRDSQSLAEAALMLAMPLAFHEETALQSRAADVVSHSPRIAALAGVGSLAEAAALAGAGEGSRLIVEKFSRDGVSCAVAIVSES
ncbi:cobalt-precorrin 5A hydrolase [Rhodoblastus acidophilus]|uniref:cobalamin biosynthesis protein n=1 Tax=Rhodoblastus acidophilus TaxID=1074 RepID=UPI0022247F4E|nr:cobalamin biosynthesis protein [Rhodoblastus acidophilus]MCW2315970.1 cobalt-precorrin 5A hydrolase [Rhodoblastus acidophilus]